MRGHWNTEYETIARIPSAFGARPIKQHFGCPAYAAVDAWSEVKIGTTGTSKRNDSECRWYHPAHRSCDPTPTELRRIEGYSGIHCPKPPAPNPVRLAWQVGYQPNHRVSCLSLKLTCR